MDIRPLKTEQTLAIRRAVLRPSLPASECFYAGEGDSHTFHLGAFVDGELASISSYYREPHSRISGQHQYRLRGMATLAEFRSRGLGSALLNAAFLILRERGCDVLWCNARVGALEFYKRHGLQTQGEQFELPGIGPHYLMWIKL